MQSTRDMGTYAAFVAAVLIGGGNFIAVSFSNRELPPLFGAALRFALAAAIFFVIMRVQRIQFPRGRAFTGGMVYGLLGFGISYAGLYYALTILPAGTVSIVMAGVPLITLLMATAVGQEKLTPGGIVGGLLTVAGIGVLSIGARNGDVELTHLLGALVGALSASASSVAARNYRDVHPVSMNALGMATGALMLAAGSVIIGEPWRLPVERTSWIALAYLIAFGSVGLFQLFLHIIHRWAASAATFALSAMPVVAAGLAALMLDQPITVELVIGGAMVIGAVYVGAIRGMKRPTGRESAGELEYMGRAAGEQIVEPE